MERGVVRHESWINEAEFAYSLLDENYFNTAPCKMR
ncbi:hypothetical protein C5S29_11420 [ANME-1 cluster archaeon GoMg3.2]|nr:hypothetical protein [ANME-1 cluster archaeon GoMg3.2]